jgi:dTDP-4-dehydrorhamnose reductase
MKSKIFITGGSGLLALNWALAQRADKEIILGLHTRQVNLAGVRTTPIDLDSVGDIYQKLETLQPNLVIHMAGMTNVEACELHPHLAERVNVDLAINVAKVCKNLDLSFVHLSTDHLFSGKKSFIDEAETPCPLNTYGRTKAKAEIGILAVNPTALIIRTNFYGWGTQYRNSFSDFIINELRLSREVILFKDIFYTPILVQRLAKVTHALIDCGACGVFNVVGKERISKYDFGVKLAEKFNLNLNLIKAGLSSDRMSSVARPRDMSLSNNKAVKFLGYQFGSIDEDLTRLYEQEKMNFSLELSRL